MSTEWKNITDPEELFRLKREEWEIEWSELGVSWWKKWNGISWNAALIFRARPSQPKMKKVKYLCYADTYALTWRAESVPMWGAWIRQPHLDLEGEIPE